ncbi:MAG: hypothetical protein ACFNKK_03735, partial [Peptidiphaga sp.]
FRDLSAKLSELAVAWLGTQQVVVAAPLGHDSPDELNMPNAPGAFPISAVDEHPGRRRSAFFHAG